MYLTLVPTNNINHPNPVYRAPMPSIFFLVQARLEENSVAHLVTSGDNDNVPLIIDEVADFGG